MLHGLGLFTDIVIAAAISGASCSLVGFYLSNLRLPFMGVCLSHAALVGALIAQWAGLPVQPLAFAAALLVALSLGPLADRARLELGMSLGILFTTTMGIAFLLIGLMPGPRSEALGLIWGSVLFVRSVDLWVMAVLLALVVGYVALFDKELRAVLFDRETAASAGVRETLVFYSLLLVSGGVVAVHLDVVGGLMLYGLLVAPAATAKQIGWGYASCLVATLMVGMAGSVGGLAVSYLVGAPTGASIVVVLGVLFGGSVIYARSRR